VSSAKDHTLRELLGAPAMNAELADPKGYRQRIYHELANHSDPLLREIGEQLCDGLVRPHQLLAIPAYAEVLDRGLENLRQLDLSAIRTALLDYLESRKRDGGPEQ
jgi:hypothetical protein